jgi:hypothetical protein
MMGGTTPGCRARYRRRRGLIKRARLSTSLAVGIAGQLTRGYLGRSQSMSFSGPGKLMTW